MKQTALRAGRRDMRWAITSFSVILVLGMLPSVRAESFDELVKKMNAAFISDWNPEIKDHDGKQRVYGKVELDKSAGRLTIRFEQLGDLVRFRTVSLLLKDIDLTSVDARGNPLTDIRKYTFFASTKGGRKTVETVEAKTGKKEMDSGFAFTCLMLGNDEGFFDAFTALVKASSR